MPADPELNDRADDAMWHALETNKEEDWNTAIDLAQQADEADRQS